jgi:hypothetical protein
MRQLQDKAKEAALGFQASVDQHRKKGRVPTPIEAQGGAFAKAARPGMMRSTKKEGPPKRALKDRSVDRDQAVLV